MRNGHIYPNPFLILDIEDLTDEALQDQVTIYQSLCGRLRDAPSILDVLGQVEAALVPLEAEVVRRDL